jgi:predicted nucleic acid-binding protein
MADLFVDTSGWASLVDTTQPYHQAAARLYRQARQQKRKLVTTNYIITELVALLTSPLRVPRLTTISFIDGLKASPYVDVVHVDVTLDEDAWHLLKKHQDKAWSLVDCASFVVMTKRSITEALATDRHFEQAGFASLLRE